GARIGKARDLLVGDAHRVLDRVGHAGQARSEHDRDARHELAQTVCDDIRGRADGTTPRSPLPVRHNRIPANVADRKFASVPAIMARNPSRARSCLRSGTSAPMPPIWIPTELMFANPHSANVAMVKDTGSSCPRSGPSWA